MAEIYKSVTELMKVARSNKTLRQSICDIVDFQEIIDDTPNADAVPVVRCKNCKSYNGHRYCNYHADPVDDNDYCSYGERKCDDGKL